ncbi:MAG: type II toxin-antitoxin system PemK/MazF family toxin [Bifidobacteriaceae bacterium]|jgi:mRNA-degrading endonuclease toxin of MazEF toxin-antitoxin module|nr:type II toxin-antitoxin system PemK/MazF family toxin [Bifidobacteriaceae bacterium]
MRAQAGEVYYASLDPARGTEQRGTRPVIVISATQMGSRVIVVPTTTSRRDWPTRVRISLYGTNGDAMCEQVRAIDVSRLEPDRYAVLLSDVLAEIRETVARLIGVY